MFNLSQIVPLPGAAVAAAAFTTTAATTPPLKTLGPNYEWIYPNTSDGKYFTATQGQVYIGNLFIDELVSLQFAYQGNRIPIYGYSSRKADAFGTGRVLVQGQLALNFVCEGYLYTALKEYDRMMTPFDVADDGSAELAGLVEQYQHAVDAGDAATASALNDQIEQVAAQRGPDAIAAARGLLTQPAASNAIELDIPFDIHCTLTGGGRTVERILRNCLLTSNEQVYSQDGSVLLDVYGFVARDAN